ncbi:DUF4886 domain-containing protein [Runella slithyformis]|uniref:SGNH/GDSL hydrolase family protein n=1 Tax=Runella slithyformis (strain ATCC 29530 / DSM 19594 / LMG 11500 / NCIMB 11436 / LSU 4) TaxID=761193 RepID=A0A7U3ZPM5_RUNSL|nr:DUF4886 domain-containing protein [Runella slithyformis]AEI51052.1 hypothetical protein Runsl_4734 [Runella slithyformis DSM 19594]
MMKKFVLGIFFVLGVTAARAQPVLPKELKILFIGNSYTYGNDLPELLSQLMAGKGIKLYHESVTPGGATLEKHWMDGKSKEAIHKLAWDYVVLQEQSTRPFSNRDAFFQYAKLFTDEIKTTKAKPLFYMTWAAKATPDEQPKLSEAYRTIAKETGSMAAPVGEAWKQANLVGMDLFISDGRHPNLLGSYLAGCVIYQTITGKSALELSRQLLNDGQPRAGLSESQAETLQRIADEIMLLK